MGRFHWPDISEHSVRPTAMAFPMETIPSPSSRKRSLTATAGESPPQHRLANQWRTPRTPSCCNFSREDVMQLLQCKVHAPILRGKHGAIHYPPGEAESPLHLAPFFRFGKAFDRFNVDQRTATAGYSPPVAPGPRWRSASVTGSPISGSRIRSQAPFIESLSVGLPSISIMASPIRMSCNAAGGCARFRLSDASSGFPSMSHKIEMANADTTKGLVVWEKRVMRLP